jgi:LacI family transcriptional regulator
VLLALTWYAVAVHRGITRYAQDARWILDGGFVRRAGGGDVPNPVDRDGIITVSGLNPELDRMVDQSGLPTVNIGYATAPHTTTVCSDSALVGKMAAEHFIERGFTNTAFYVRTNAAGERGRREAFDAALRAAGREPFIIDPYNTLGKFRPLRAGETVYQRILEQLVDLPKPIAVFAEYDDRAVEFMDAALLGGFRIPEQVAVLGVDNDELRCPFAPVPLSSIDNSEERIGYEAARQLDLMMQGKPPEPEPICIPPRAVVVRQSTNILAVGHEHVATALRLIWEHYTEPIDALRVAAQIPLSYPQLHTAFVRHVGHTLADEIERRRIEHAQELLGTTGMKLSEVARRSGFGSGDRMGRVFMRQLGITPSDYRKQFRSNRIPPPPTDPQDRTAKPALLQRVQQVDPSAQAPRSG